MVSVDYIFDFGSPNAYLAHKVIPGIEARTGAQFNYVPVLLGGVFKATNNQSPIAAFASVKNKLAYQQREIERFIERHGLYALRMNPHFPINTLTIMRGALVAERDARLADYVDAMFAAVWERELKMDDPAVIAAALDEAGFEGAALLEATQDPEIKAKLAQNTEAAVERGVFGAPTFFVGEEMYFGKDRLGEVEEAIGQAA
ncbi:MAG: 2-hydroxychromene-2-carboxylate isomerase [Maricaulaceae bacterium]|jgi:2-hydroxychromene-2-carboxylate isomerase